VMGGEITVISQVGVGSRFEFSIPVQVIAPEQIEAEALQRHVVGLVAGQPVYRILVVEDVTENRQLIRDLLLPVGFEVNEAVNGQEAIELNRSWQPHLIWMDMRMPILDGYEATRQIKANSSAGLIPVIIALTGSAFEEDRILALSVGCDDFVRKPVRAEVLFEKMAEWLGIFYVYSYVYTADRNLERQETLISRPDLTELQTIQRMPLDWLNQLRQAAIRVSSRQIYALIQQISTTEPGLSKALTQLVDHFRFEYLIELTEEALREQDSPDK
jgi:CheY-like chemotaxis protein